MKTVVSEKGQVTIPKPLRDSLALTPGTELDFEEREGLLVGRRVTDHDPLSRLVGLLPRMDVDKAVHDLRGPAWSPPSIARFCSTSSQTTQVGARIRSRRFARRGRSAHC